MVEARIRVIYGDTDQMGVVYYANYLRFFEGARGHFIRGLGLSYAEIEDRAILLPVIEASVQYVKSAKYDDVLLVHLSQTHTRVKIRFEYKVHREADQTLVAIGHTVHVCVGPQMRPTRAPDWLLQRLDAAGGRQGPGNLRAEGNNNG